MSASTPAVTVLIKKKVKRIDTSIGAGIGAGTSGGTGAKEDVQLQGANKKQKTSSDAVAVVASSSGDLPPAFIYLCGLKLNAVPNPILILSQPNPNST